MSKRMGVTALEEYRIRKAIEAGTPWDDIKGTLTDVDEAYVFENIYTPMKEAVEAGTPAPIDPIIEANLKAQAAKDAAERAATEAAAKATGEKVKKV